MTDYPINMSVKPQVEAFFDPATNTISYVVRDPSSNACAVIDSVMDIDYAAGRITYDHADAIIDYIKASTGCTLEWLIETHVHADHLSGGALYPAAAGRQDGHRRQYHWSCRTRSARCSTRAPSSSATAASSTALFNDGDTYKIGGMDGLAIHTPGHTPACMTHVMGDAAFVGDTLFMPDGGSARADFPGGDAGSFTIRSRRCWRCPTRRGCSCATTTVPTAATSQWETTVAEEKATTSMSATAATTRGVRARCARSATPRWTCPG